MSAQMHAQATYVRLENYTKACEIIIFFVMKQTKKPWMCSVLLQALKRRSEHSRSREILEYVLCFSHFFRALTASNVICNRTGHN